MGTSWEGCQGICDTWAMAFRKAWVVAWEFEEKLGE